MKSVNRLVIQDLKREILFDGEFESVDLEILKTELKIELPVSFSAWVNKTGVLYVTVAEKVFV